MHFGGLPYKTKQFFLVLIKLSIVVGAFYFIYKKLVENDNLDFSTFLQFLTENNVFSIKNLIFLLLLTFLNWFLEILKWKVLVNSIKNISIKNAMEQSLGALTASLFTPNRIGEYGAKAIYYSFEKRKPILLLNLIGNTMQMLVTISFGIIGLSILNSKYDLNIDYFKAFRFLIIVVIIILFTFLGLKQSKLKIRGFSIEKLKNFYRSISTKTKALGILLSMMRYLVFSFQFYCFLRFFGISVSYFNAMVVISSMYFLASIVPSIFIFDVVIKSSVAVYLFSIVGVNEFTTLSIVTLMWLFNFVLPSLFGSYYVLNFNLPNNHNQ